MSKLMCFEFVDVQISKLVSRVAILFALFTVTSPVRVFADSVVAVWREPRNKRRLWVREESSLLVREH